MRLDGYEPKDKEIKVSSLNHLVPNSGADKLVSRLKDEVQTKTNKAIIDAIEHCKK